MISRQAAANDLVDVAAEIDHELRQLPPVDLETAMGVDLLSRIDTKLALPLDGVRALLRQLRSRAGDDYRLVVTPVGYAPRYTTLYFDTADLRHYLDHHNGRRLRHKVRYRRYDSTGASFFEIKQRTSARRTTKTRVPVPEMRPILHRAERALAEELRLDVDGLIPTLQVVYHRVTLVGDDQRVTIDLDLACQARNRERASFGATAIVEIKDGSRRPGSPLATTLRALGLRPHSLSKYCVGVASCFDGVKHNRFQPALRRLRP